MRITLHHYSHSLQVHVEIAVLPQNDLVEHAAEAVHVDLGAALGVLDQLRRHATLTFPAKRHIAGDPQNDTWMLLLFSAVTSRQIAHQSPAHTRSPPVSPSRSSAAHSRAACYPRGNLTFTSRCTTLKECRYSSAIAMSSANPRFSAKLNLRHMRHPMKLPPLLDQQVLQTRSAQLHHQHGEPLG